jgi:hypothetical protein
LFIGTFDWSYLLYQGFIDLLLEPFVAEGTLSEGESLQAQVIFPPYRFGADLFRITSNSTPAIPEDVEGLGNPMNYGIRTSVVVKRKITDSSPPDAAYFGTANPMNLLPLGGWELIRMGLTSSSALQPTTPTPTPPPGGSDN